MGHNFYSEGQQTHTNNRKMKLVESVLGDWVTNCSNRIWTPRRKVSFFSLISRIYEYVGNHGKEEFK